MPTWRRRMKWTSAPRPPNPRISGSNKVSRSIKIAFAAEQIMRECGLLQELWELEDYTKSLPKPGEPKDRKECVL